MPYYANLHIRNQDEPVLLSFRTPSHRIEEVKSAFNLGVELERIVASKLTDSQKNDAINCHGIRFLVEKGELDLGYPIEYCPDCRTYTEWTAPKDEGGTCVRCDEAIYYMHIWVAPRNTFLSDIGDVFSDSFVDTLFKYGGGRRAKLVVEPDVEKAVDAINKYMIDYINGSGKHTLRLYVPYDAIEQSDYYHHILNAENVSKLNIHETQWVYFCDPNGYERHFSAFIPPGKVLDC